MASSFVRVNEYRRQVSAGVSTIRSTGHGMRLRPDKVTYIYQAGTGYDGPASHNVFTVHLTGGRSFITDWDGIGNLEHVRVNEYDRIVQEDGSTKLQYTDHGVRVYPPNVVRAYTAGLGYELDGETTHECFRVTLVDGSSFITDWAGWETIQGW